MATYKILGTDGKQYGPVSDEVLRQWIAQKRATSTTMVQIEGETGWKPLSSLPEFADALAVRPPALAVPPPASPVGEARTSRLAIASLVCGILGFLCLPALASLVLGIVALLKIGKSEGRLRGQGLAIAGICVAGLMLITVVPAAMLFPALARAKQKATQIKCISNLKMIALAARIYSTDNNEVFPPTFAAMSNELAFPKLLVCPADSKHQPAAAWQYFDPRVNVSYEYLQPGIAESNAMNMVIFRCPIHGNVALGDGSAQRPLPGRSSVGPVRPVRAPR
jgi:hypothetical protein